MIAAMAHPLPPRPAAAEPTTVQRRQRAKNRAVGIAVAALCVLFFIITIVRMGRS
jgi:ferric-dicitrate binding protein FerR (iron transport regulator)